MIIIFRGSGKGKTSASLGVALRAVGWGKRVIIIQFIKKWKVGEHRAIEKYLKKIKIIPAGQGFVGIMGDKLEKKAYPFKKTGSERPDCTGTTSDRCF